MHNQQNHNHQEHHHAEGDAAATTATAKLSMAAAASRKTPPHRPNTPTTITIMAIAAAAAAPDDPDEESDRLAAAPLPVANVSAGKSPVWTAPAAPKNRKCRHRTPGVDNARVLFATEKLVVDAQSDISLRIQDAVAQAGFTCSALRPPKPPRRKPHASANSHRCCC